MAALGRDARAPRAALAFGAAADARAPVRSARRADHRASRWSSALLAVPILIQVYFNAGLAYWLNRAPRRGLVRRRAVRADRRQQFLRAGGRDRHRAVRLPVRRALATVVGVLVEVPVMLSVVHIVRRSRARDERGAVAGASINGKQNETEQG